MLVDVDDVSAAHRLAATVDAAAGTGTGAAPASWTAVVGFGNVVVHLDPRAARPDLVEAVAGAARPPTPATGRRTGRRHRPATGGPAGAAPARRSRSTFDGPDLDEVAAAARLHRPGAVVEHCAGPTCRWPSSGSRPGSPTWSDCPPSWPRIPRRPTPRPSVPAGSVAVGGGFASVYPRSTPGGWMLLGRTSAPAVRPDRPPYALLRRAIASASPARRRSGGRSPTGPTGPSRRRPLPAVRHRRRGVASSRSSTRVCSAWSRTAVGRRRPALGVPRAGPADPDAMRLANRLVGNPDGAAAIEVTAVGPTLRFTGDAHVAVVGAGRRTVEVLRSTAVRSAPARWSPVGDGQVVTVGRVRVGLRAYLAVSGGFETPLVVGSRSTDLLSGLGPGPLAAGDRLDLGPPSRPQGRLLRSARRLRWRRAGASSGSWPGPTAARRVAPPAVVPAPWAVGDASNRIGIGVAGPEPGPVPRRPPPVPMPARPVRHHAVRASPRPAWSPGRSSSHRTGIRSSSCPTTPRWAGYPVVACVIAADLPVLGQLRPGDTVRFTTVDRPTALVARHRWERMLDERVIGMVPHGRRHLSRRPDGWRRRRRQWSLPPLHPHRSDLAEWDAGNDPRREPPGRRVRREESAVGEGERPGDDDGGLIQSRDDGQLHFAARYRRT